MSSSRRGRHAQKSAADETVDTASTGVEILDTPGEVVTPDSDDDDLGPLACIETASPPGQDPKNTSGNCLTFRVPRKPFFD